MKTRIPLEEAVETLEAFTPALSAETVPLAEACGRVAAEDVSAVMDLPPFRRSPFDGYAFHACDIAGATEERPVTLPILREIPAGAEVLPQLPPGYAVKILTGAAVPDGADTVMKFEDLTFTAETVTFVRPFGPRNVIMPGEDMVKGTVLVRRGEPLTGAGLGLLAGQGIDRVRVYRRPRVALLSNGAELVEPGQPRQGSQIYNSSCHMLLQYIRDCGAQAVYEGIVGDSLDLLAARMDDALSRYDMVVITGGASVGDYDFCPRAAQKVGAELLFRKVKYRPGGSMFAAVRDGRLLLSLSGNPAAAAVTMLLLGRVGLYRLCGRTDRPCEWVDVALAEPLPASRHLYTDSVLRGHLELRGGRAMLVLNEGRGNGAVLSMRRCDLLGVIPAGTGDLEAGTLVRAALLR